MTKLSIYMLKGKFHVSTTYDYESMVYDEYYQLQYYPGLKHVKDMQFESPESIFMDKLLANKNNPGALNLLWSSPADASVLKRITKKLLPYIPLRYAVPMFSIPIDALQQMHLTLTHKDKAWLVEKMDEKHQPSKFADYVNAYQDLIEHAFIKQHRNPFWDSLTGKKYTKTDETVVSNFLDKIENAIYNGRAVDFWAGDNERFLESQLYKAISDCYPERLALLKDYSRQSEVKSSNKNTLFSVYAGSYGDNVASLKLVY